MKPVTPYGLTPFPGLSRRLLIGILTTMALGGVFPAAFMFFQKTVEKDLRPVWVDERVVTFEIPNYAENSSQFFTYDIDGQETYHAICEWTYYIPAVSPAIFFAFQRGPTQRFTVLRPDAPTWSFQLNRDVTMFVNIFGRRLKLRQQLEVWRSQQFTNSARVRTPDHLLLHFDEMMEQALPANQVRPLSESR